MQSLSEMLLLRDVQNKKKRIRIEIDNILAFKRDFRNFSGIIYSFKRIPVKRVKLSSYSKAAFLTFVISCEELFLCLNLEVIKSGRVRALSCVDSSGDIVRLKPQNTKLLNGIKPMTARTEEFVDMIDESALFCDSKWGYHKLIETSFENTSSIFRTISLFEASLQGAVVDI